MYSDDERRCRGYFVKWLLENSEKSKDQLIEENEVMNKYIKKQKAEIKKLKAEIKQLGGEPNDL